MSDPAEILHSATVIMEKKRKNSTLIIIDVFGLAFQQYYL
jgi:hypothetical protein